MLLTELGIVTLACLVALTDTRSISKIPAENVGIGVHEKSKSLSEATVNEDLLPGKRQSKQMWILAHPEIYLNPAIDPDDIIYE